MRVCSAYFRGLRYFLILFCSLSVNAESPVCDNSLIELALFSSGSGNKKEVLAAYSDLLRQLDLKTLKQMEKDWEGFALPGLGSFKKQ